MEPGQPTPPSVAVVFGTVDRLPLLTTCVESIRRAAGRLTYRILVADGNSTDGSREWLAAQPDCELLEGGRNGAVQAFNVAFARAVDLGCPYIVQFNDDISFVDGGELERAVALLEYPLQGGAQLGAVAFCSDRYTPGSYTFENMRFHGINYCNQGMFRREAIMAAARILGDPTGRTPWDRRYKTYAADTVLGLLLHRLGWLIGEAHDIRVHDGYASGGTTDPLRTKNLNEYTNGDLFTRQWGNPRVIRYNRAEAIKYGGRILDDDAGCGP